MFLHEFKYSLKILLKNKPLVFWTYIFPLFLGLFFNLAFSNISESEKFDVIDIAIIDNEDFNKNKAIKEAFKTLSEGENKIFNTSYVSIEEANKLLDEKEIIGYLEIIDEKPNLKFKNNGISQTIFKIATSEIMQTNKLISSVSEDYINKEIEKGNYNIDYNKIHEKIDEIVSQEYELHDVSSSKLDYVVIEFYTLIAMTCLYGGMLGMFSINNCLANMSNKGKRISVSPAKKISVIMGSLLSGYLVQIIGLIILFLFLIFVLGVDFGNRVGYIILTGFVGSFAGLSMGLSIGSILKCNQNSKIGILIAYTMFCTFFAGMFGMTMKYVVDTKLPILNKVNPSSLITDALYALYYYTNLNRYWSDIISLLIFSSIFIIASIICLRRQKYDSI